MLSSTPLAIAIFVLGFGLLVFVHELGHFLVARLFGVRCTQFAIGFGNALLTWRKGIGVVAGGTERRYYDDAEKKAREDGVDLDALPDHEKAAKLHAAADQLGYGETEYRLNFLPLGGYVKMVGQEDLDPDARSSDPRAYNNKPIWQRMGIISAGVVMNLIFGVIFFIAAFMMGVDFPASTVGGVVPGSPAYVTYAEGHEDDPAFQGLRIGDTITHIDGEPIRDMVEVRVATALGAPRQAIRLRVERPGMDEALVFPVTPKMRRSVPGEAKMLSAGITPTRTLRVSSLTEEGSAYTAGVRPGMTITTVAGEGVATYHQWLAAMGDARGEPVEVVFEGEDGQSVRLELAASAELARSDAGVANLLGLTPATAITLVVDGSPAEGAGIAEGDLLARIGDVSWPSPGEVSAAIQAAGDDGVAVAVWRGGEVVDLGRIEPTGKGMIGIGMAPAETLRVGSTLDGSAAARLDLVPGSTITSVDGKAVATWTELQAALQNRAADGAEAVRLGYRLNLAEAPQAEAQVLLDAAERARLLAAAWGPPADAGLGLAGLDATLKATNPWAATLLGVEKTHQFIVQTYLTLRRLLVEQTVKVSHLRGPAGIIDEGQRIAQRGWAYLLFFLGLISVNLAVINFLPFPILDGGHMVFLAIEKIKGSPPSPLVINIATYAALAVIATLFLVITYHDLMRIGSRIAESLGG